jgi:peptidoglycan/LPS O-acetylase OafA/YrhL
MSAAEPQRNLEPTNIVASEIRKPSEFYPALDGLRALAFLLVFGHHYLQLPWGWAGVDLFFVLSGFLITGILFDTRNDIHRVRNFYVRRTLRIFPLYYGVMLSLLLMQPLVHWQLNWLWMVWPAYLGNFARFIHPYQIGDAWQRLADFQPYGVPRHGHALLFLGHFWSLCVEEQFYLFWPWLVFGIRDRRKLLLICAATLPLCLIARITGQHLLPNWMLENEVLYRATPFRIDALLLGGLIALVLRGAHRQMILRVARIGFPVYVVILLLCALLSVHGKISQLYAPYPTWVYTWGLFAIDILSAFLILVVIHPNSFSYKVFSAPALRWIGRISYGAYILHDMPHLIYLRIGSNVIQYAHRFWPAIDSESQHQVVIVTAAIAFASTLIMAATSFRFFERPFLNLKERWAARAS